MPPHYSTKSKRTDDRSKLLIVSLLLSLGLHLIVVLALPLIQEDKSQPWQQQPTIVHLVDMPVNTKKPQQQGPVEFEIDQSPPNQPPEIPVESFRKADHDQKVIREQAPRGEDVRDQTSKLPNTTLPLQPKQKLKTQEETKSLSKKPPEIPRPIEVKTLKKTAKKTLPTTPQKKQEQWSQPPPLTPDQLRPNLRTLEQIANGSQGSRNRVKERKNIEIGDTVWLNLQQNLLISFFRRFHDQIELVWNYPVEAAIKGIEGTLELLITVNKKGQLIDVDLLQTSGSDLLDFEAIQAIYRAAPFGPMTKHYPHEILKIRAHFSYRMTGQYIYGR